VTYKESMTSTEVTQTMALILSFMCDMMLNARVRDGGWQPGFDTGIDVEYSSCHLKRNGNLDVLLKRDGAVFLMFI